MLKEILKLYLNSLGKRSLLYGHRNVTWKSTLHVNLVHLISGDSVVTARKNKKQVSCFWDTWARRAYILLLENCTLAFHVHATSRQCPIPSFTKHRVSSPGAHFPPFQGSKTSRWSQGEIYPHLLSKSPLRYLWPPPWRMLTFFLHTIHSHLNLKGREQLQTPYSIPFCMNFEYLPIISQCIWLWW